VESPTVEEQLPRYRRTRWIGPIVVVIVAVITRFWNITYPSVLNFDEHFYVKDAYSLLKLGYEGHWRAPADAAFATGHFTRLTTTAELVQHPPLGKWIIAIGIQALGVDNPVSWRISMVVIGILAVILLMAVAYKLFRSFALMTITGGLFAIAGNAIVMSRIGMLDNAVMFFALLAFYALLLDRDQASARLGRILARTSLPSSARSRTASVPRNPTIWGRPWLIVAGLALGLDAGVKWSGFFFLAAFVAYVIGVDVLARRRVGVARGVRGWLGGTLLRQAPVDILLMVPVALAAYVASWTGWFVTSGGLYRQWANQPGHALTGVFAWVPRTVQSFWHFQVYMYNFGITFDTHKQYSSPAVDWLPMTRPTHFFVGFSIPGQDGCTSTSNCAAEITDIANPLIWWVSGLCVLFLIYRFIFRRDWRVPAILIGIVGGYVPWLLIPRGTVFQFYTIAFEPYMMLALVYVIMLTIGDSTATARRRRIGWTIVIVYLALCLLMSAFFLPLWIGLNEPLWFIRLHYWFPGWV
jgi:dolichyl-phosphate-mannose-protein mannosyltransferase